MWLTPLLEICSWSVGAAARVSECDSSPTEQNSLLSMCVCVARCLVCKLLIGCRAFQLKACYLSLISVYFLEKPFSPTLQISSATPLLLPPLSK